MKKLIGCIALFVFFLAGCGGKYEEKEREIGYKGKARLNPLLAAERLALKMGMEVGSYPGMPELPPPSDTTLVLPAASLQSAGVLEQMDEWMSRGGNLVVYLSLDSSRSLFESDWAEEEKAMQPFLDYFGFAIQEIDASKVTMDFGRQEVSEVYLGDEGPYEVDFSVPRFLSDTDVTDVGGTARSEDAVLSYDYGEGYLTVVTSTRFFQNRNLDKAEHATLLWDILNMGEDSAVWFVRSVKMSFFRLLWQRAPEALVLLLLLLVVSIWWAARGFGPRFLRGTQPVAQLDEHLEASGAFFLKHGAEGEVLQHWREKLFRRLARATNQPFNIARPELLAQARKIGVLTEEESAALTDQPTDRTLISLLQKLKNLDKKL